MIFNQDDTLLLHQMQLDFEKVASNKEQHLKQLLHPRDLADKNTDKSNQQNGSGSGNGLRNMGGGYQNGYDDSQDSNQAKENAYKEEYLKQLKLVDPPTQSLQQAMTLKLKQLVKQAEQASLPSNYMFPEHPNGTIKTPVEAYQETFGIKHSYLIQQQTTLGVDHLLNEDDKHRLKNANNQMRNFLEEITSDNIHNGYLTSKLITNIGEQISDEMKEFSAKLIDRKRRDEMAFQDLATTKTLPQDTMTSKRLNNQSSRQMMSGDWPRIRTGSFTGGGSIDTEDDHMMIGENASPSSGNRGLGYNQLNKKKEELQQKLGSLRDCRRAAYMSQNHNCKNETAKMNPLDLRIEDFLCMQLSNTSSSNLGTPVLNTSVLQKRREIENTLKAHVCDNPNKHVQLNKFIKSLFEDRIDLEPWVSEIEIVNDDSATISSSTPEGDNFHHKFKELQIADIGIFRDLGPLARNENETDGNYQMSKLKIEQKYLKHLHHNYQQRQHQKSQSGYGSFINQGTASQTGQQVNFLSEDKYHLSIANLLPLTSCNTNFQLNYIVFVMPNQFQHGALNYISDEKLGRPIPQQEDYDSPIKNSPHNHHLSADVCDSFLTDLPGAISNAIINLLEDLDNVSFDLQQKNEAYQQQIVEEAQEQDEDGDESMIKEHQSLVDMLHAHQSLKEESKLTKKKGDSSQPGTIDERLAGMSESQLKNELLNKFKIIGGDGKQIINNQSTQANKTNFNSKTTVKNISGGQQTIENSKEDDLNQINTSVRFNVQEGQLIPQYEIAILDKLKLIEEFRGAKQQLEKNLEQLKKTYEADPKQQKKIKQMGGPTLQQQALNIKNVEKMRLEVNKRIEQYMLEIIQLLDDMNSKKTGDSRQTGFSIIDDINQSMDEEDIMRVISTETILRASSIAEEDIDETIKAKYISRFVKEYRKNREKAKQDSLREQMEKEIQRNIQKRFPTLTGSPDRPRQQSGGRNNINTSSNGKQQAKKRGPTESNTNPFEGSFIMKKGWGVEGGNSFTQQQSRQKQQVTQQVSTARKQQPQIQQKRLPQQQLQQNQRRDQAAPSDSNNIWI